MQHFMLSDFTAEILCDGPNKDAVLDTTISGNTLSLRLTTKSSLPTFVTLHWAFQSDPDILVLGDCWERSYANLEFCALKDNDRYMPWYFIADAKQMQYCFGVKTQPNAFVSFRYDTDGVTAWIDCRNGSGGVALNGRTIQLCEFVFRAYDSDDTFACLQDYCKQLCDCPLLPDRMIYGGNNWYYAYGKSDYETIVSDAALQARLAEGLENRPYMVIDDGWQINGCAGPWLPNKKFRDMKALADEIKAMDVLPGIWIRPLFNRDKSIRKDMLLKRGKKAEYLDPTVPAVQDLLRDDVMRIRDWGYQLLKYDYTTVDLFGRYCREFTKTISDAESWHFFDRSKTNAEIVLDPRSRRQYAADRVQHRLPSLRRPCPTQPHRRRHQRQRMGPHKIHGRQHACVPSGPEQRVLYGRRRLRRHFERLHSLGKEPSVAGFTGEQRYGALRLLRPRGRRKGRGPFRGISRSAEDAQSAPA